MKLPPSVSAKMKRSLHDPSKRWVQDRSAGRSYVACCPCPRTEEQRCHLQRAPPAGNRPFPVWFLALQKCHGSRLRTRMKRTFLQCGGCDWEVWYFRNRCHSRETSNE